MEYMDISKDTVVNIGYDSYLVFDGETMDDAKEIHQDSYTLGYYVCLYEGISSERTYIKPETAKTESFFNSWEDAENYFECH